MKTYRAGESVSYGVYFSTRPIDMHLVSAEGELLEGKSDATYRRMPTWLAVAFGPLIGGAFVIAFPAILLAVLFMAAGKAIMSLVRGAAESNVHLAGVRWEPTAAYLNKPDGEDGENRKDGEPAELSVLETEVEARKSDEG